MYDIQALALQKLIETVWEVLARVPRSLIGPLSVIVGGLWKATDRRHYRIAMSNIRQAFGEVLDEKACRGICRKNFRHLARVALEIPSLGRLSKDNLDQYVSFCGVDHLFQALRRDRGVLILASHFGNWELMAVAFSIRYRPVHLVVRPVDHPVLDRLISRVRCLGGNRLIPKKRAIRRIMKALSEGGIVGILLDQNVDWYEGVFVPFLGRLACTSKSLSVIAMRTGSPVVPAFNKRQADGRYRITFLPEIELSTSGEFLADVEENTARFNRCVEKYVLSDPEQWFWVHQRWKTRPYQPWPR